jgi:mRNA-degrading endonuclease RelE of RelBE toxin-antitoxin system
MHVVDGLFVGNEYRTDVWIAERVAKALNKFQKRGDGRRFLQKLEHYAKAGFQEFTGRDAPIRSEGHGVWRVRHSSLFRLIGFYDDGTTAFIAMDAFTKSGTRLSVAERRRINKVAQVKRGGLWKKRQQP